MTLYEVMSLVIGGAALIAAIIRIYIALKRR